VAHLQAGHDHAGNRITSFRAAPATAERCESNHGCDRPNNGTNEYVWRVGTERSSCWLELLGYTHQILLWYILFRFLFIFLFRRPHCSVTVDPAKVHDDGPAKTKRGSRRRAASRVGGTGRWFGERRPGPARRQHATVKPDSGEGATHEAIGRLGRPMLGGGVLPPSDEQSTVVKYRKVKRYSTRLGARAPVLGPVHGRGRARFIGRRAGMSSSVPRIGPGGTGRVTSCPSPARDRLDHSGPSSSAAVGEFVGAAVQFCQERRAASHGGPLAFTTVWPMVCRADDWAQTSASVLQRVLGGRRAGGSFFRPASAAAETRGTRRGRSGFPTCVPDLARPWPRRGGHKDPPVPSGDTGRRRRHRD